MLVWSSPAVLTAQSLWCHWNDENNDETFIIIVSSKYPDCILEIRLAYEIQVQLKVQLKVSSNGVWNSIRQAAGKTWKRTFTCKRTVLAFVQEEPPSYTAVESNRRKCKIRSVLIHVATHDVSKSTCYMCGDIITRSLYFKQMHT